ncbi:hypothetical protein [Inconstantimicrobium mannanitabidum]|uniref:Uncharacterized protein n=1 Tax=Inconstantimicrobium mannanitabidum TaxID=1604901 RepID=A0ACB5RHK3_9CLOT|nr:hypothetical protein [Clostridium sp. TW13]GKX68562.1 hypothetical protein rsdtw13_38200 [Clostridium sp. TW13]
MELCEELKKDYLDKLEELLNVYNGKSKELRKQGANDEAILETIKGNIVDIFSKVFNVSYNKSCKSNKAQKDKLNDLSMMYLAFFDKISAPWKEKMAKDKEHDMMEEYYIEEIKLETAEKVKAIFLEYHDKY